MTEIPVVTTTGILMVEGERVGDVWAVTKKVDVEKKRGRIWRVTHLPSGRATTKPTTKEKARLVARALERECGGGEWKTANPNAIPTEAFLRALRIIEERGVEPTRPSSDLVPRHLTEEKGR